MLSYCLKCRKIQNAKTLRLQKGNKKVMFLKNMWCVIVKNQDLPKNKKQAN